MVNINLLPDTKSKQEKQQVIIQKFNRIFLLVAVIFLLSAIGSFIVKQIISQNLVSMNKEIQAQAKIIKENEETEGLLYGIKNRLSSVTGILQGRQKYSFFLTNFSKYVPQSIKISDLTIADVNKVVINGEAPSYEKVAGFLLVLSGETAPEGESTTIDKKIFSNVSLITISKTTTGGNVTFSISFTAEKGAFDE